MKIAAVVTLVIAAAMAFAFREQVAGTRILWLSLGVPYALIGGLGLHRLYRDGTLATTLRPRAGDVSIGAVLAAALFGAAWLIKHTYFGYESGRAAWLFRLALQLGNVRPSPLFFVTIALIASLEELVWRGLVLQSLAESVGTRRAWPIAAFLYALVHIPTAFLLAVPLAGPNPILLIASAGCGLVWSFAASMMGRLPAVMVSHAVFSYFAIAVLLPHFG
jgi:membrane protease YdiL (CAAX protease family)